MLRNNACYIKQNKIPSCFKFIRNTLSKRLQTSKSHKYIKNTHTHHVS